jgi:hypothetical protein
MGIGIFNRLGFPASMANNTIDFSAQTQNSLNNMPQILTTWQMEDIANSNTYGYFVNPVSDYANTLNSTVLSMQSVAISGNLTTIYNSTSNVTSSNTIISFREHTDRLSGVTPLDANANNALLPHYNNCIGLGKALTYIVYQSDGISNNAVIMGNFGSLYTTNTLSNYSTTLQNDLILMQNSISAGNSNLSLSQINSIISHLTTMNTFVYNSVTQDVNYYNNCRAIINDYNSVKGFGYMGDTEKYLVNTLIGSEKLKARVS